MMAEIKFWTPRGTYGFLSNFYPSPMEIDGCVYPTNEHYFQSQKFAGLDEEIYIINLPSPGEAAKEGRRRDFRLRADWEDAKESVMLKGLLFKFDDRLLRKRLLDTGDHTLTEDSPYDYYWGVGRKGDGKNRLGVLLMQVRDIKRNEGVGD